MLFTFDDNYISYLAKNIKIGETLTFDVASIALLNISTWDNLIYKVKGRSYQTGSLLYEMQKYYQYVAVSTRRRINMLHNQREKFTQNYLDDKNKLALMKKLYSKTDKRYRELVKTHKVILLNLLRKEIQFKSYLDNHAELKAIINNNLIHVCQLKTCRGECIPMIECKICTNELYKTINTVICEQGYKLINTSRRVTYQSVCEVVSYKFTNVYTGSCHPGSRKQQILDGLWFGLLGALFAAILPLSCSKSYEVHTERILEQKPCTLTKWKIFTTRITTSHCYDVLTSTSTGYSSPTECNCTTNPCFSKLPQPQCVLDNTFCSKKRQLFATSINKLPKFYTDMHNSINTLKNDARNVYLDLEKQRTKTIFHQN